MYLKRLKSSKFVRVKAFPMYGGIGVSAPSLHRESIDSLIKWTNGILEISIFEYFYDVYANMQSKVVKNSHNLPKMCRNLKTRIGNFTQDTVCCCCSSVSTTITQKLYRVKK